MENEDEEILTLYKKYKGKFEEIRKLNRKCQLWGGGGGPTRFFPIFSDADFGIPRGDRKKSA